MATSMNSADDVKNHPTANLVANQQATEELTESEKQVLEELRQTYFEITQIEILQHKSIFEVEVCIDESYKRIFDERKAILQQFTSGPLKRFWVKVFQAAGILLSADDEKILNHLIDVRSKMVGEPKVKMLLEFEFEKNPYFSNQILTKTYHIKCHADLKNAVIYDGIEITSTEGTKINWLVERKTFTAEEDRQYSFFDFFGNHSDNENVNRAALGEEIAFGFFLREKVIPKAIYFFTGDIQIHTIDKNSAEHVNETKDTACKKDKADADYDGDSEGDSDMEQAQEYVKFENELDAKELAENEKEKEAPASTEQHRPSNEEESHLNEAENQPLIDTGDES